MSHQPSYEGDQRDSTATVNLLGRFTVVAGGRELDGFDGRRVQELLAYLIVNHGRPIPREVVADRLWSDGRGDCRKQLRHTLWQLQCALAAAVSEPILYVDTEWVQLVAGPTISSDVCAVKAAERGARGIAGSELSQPFG